MEEIQQNSFLKLPVYTTSIQNATSLVCDQSSVVYQLLYCMQLSFVRKIFASCCVMVINYLRPVLVPGTHIPRASKMFPAEDMGFRVYYWSRSATPASELHSILPGAVIINPPPPKKDA